MFLNCFRLILGQCYHKICLVLLHVLQFRPTFLLGCCSFSVQSLCEISAELVVATNNYLLKLLFLTCNLNKLNFLFG